MVVYLCCARVGHGASDEDSIPVEYEELFSRFPATKDLVSVYLGHGHQPVVPYLAARLV